MILDLRQLTLAPFLGFPGFLPFVVLSGVVMVRHDNKSCAFMLLIYGAIISTFVGSVHLGLALQSDPSCLTTQIQFFRSIVPAILAWSIAVTMTMAWALVAMSSLFAISIYVDWMFSRIINTPAWYFRMRFALSPCVSIIFPSAGSALWI